jgi:HK97 family phage major capsid protein
MTELKEALDALDSLNRDLKEFRDANDERLTAIEKDRGVAELEEKLEKIDKAIDDAQQINERYAVEQEELKKRLDEAEAALDRRGPGGRVTDEEKAAADYKAAFIRLIRGAEDKGSNVGDLAVEVKQLERKMLETKEVNTLTGAAGGFAVPEEIAMEIAMRELDWSAIRRDVKVVTIGTSDYKELVDLNGAGTEWLGETATRNITDSATLRERAPTLGTLSAKPRATEESLLDMQFSVEQWIIDSVVRGFAEAEGAAVLTGDGSNKPTGMLNTAPSSITDDLAQSPQRSAEALRYLPIETGSPASFQNGDGLIDMVYSLKAGYRSNAVWAMNSLTGGATRKLKDSQGQYLWAPGIAAGEPSTLLGYPVRYWEDLADLAADSLSILFGDFQRGYLMVDRAGMRMTVDDITVPGYVNFYIRKRVGGIILDNNAIRVGKRSDT